jgi:ribosomal protein S12 methylthiotransferase accessory factor
MTAPLHKRHRLGTHRSRVPEETLSLITPLLRELGVTRCADVTGLDSIGIHTFSAIRPRGRVLQVTNGKGLRRVDAKVSALMEAIELEHAERAPREERLATVEELTAGGERFCAPERLGTFRKDVHFDERLKVSWVPGEELCVGQPAWVPASSVHYTRPMLFDFSTNGLASGNHVVEATVHALGEVIERDALSRLRDRGKVHFERCGVIDLGRVRDEAVGSLCERVANAGMKLVLLRVDDPAPWHTFAAALLDPDPFAHASTVNIGYGTHLSPSVAAVRAITEAAQSRLTFIHGAREDLTEAAYRNASQSEVARFFRSLEPNARFADLEDRAGFDLAADLALMAGTLAARGHHEIYRAVLSAPKDPVAVVKVLVPGALATLPM